MGGYCYGERQPTETCPCCGGRAHAEFCDVGVGYVQVAPYECEDCGAFQDVNAPPFFPDGSRHHGWKEPSKPSELGERVTGYFIRPTGMVAETTFDNGHREMAQRLGTTESMLRLRGWIRVTNLEGYAVSLPAFVTSAAARALRDVMETIGDEWGLPWVTTIDGDHGREMALPKILKTVAGLPKADPREAIDSDGIAEPRL